MRQLKRVRLDVEEPAVNLTPLIDVVFLVLIVFILIAPLLEMEHIELADSSPVKKEKTEFLSGGHNPAIHVYKDNSIKVDQQEMTLAQLTAYLREMRKQDPSSVPQLYQDKGATFGTYQSVKNAVELAGFTDLDLVLQ